MPDGSAAAIRVGPLNRDASVLEFVRKASAPEVKASTLTFSASSETPVERFWGTEVLAHDDKAVRLERVRGGNVPILFNHNPDDVIGMADSARLADGRLEVTAHLFDTERAEAIAAMIDGGLRNISVGYRIHLLEENTKTQVYRATDWEPMEFSVVSMPADPTIGIGRDADKQAIEVRVIRENPAEPANPVKESKMPDITAPAGNLPDEQANLSAVDAEKQRRGAIENLAKANNIDDRVVARWIQSGARLEAVSEDILRVMEERGKQTPQTAAALGLSKGETQQYSVLRAIKAMRFGEQHSSVRESCAFEIECSNQVAKRLGRDVGVMGNVLIPAEVLSRPLNAEAAQRAMATTPGAKGGYLVQTENMGFIDILRNRSVSMSLGARVLSGLSGNVAFARQTGKASVTWQAGEHVSVTASDQALGQITMTPRTAIAITDVSEQLLRQSTPSAESFIMADLARDIAIDGVDNAVINGTGGAQPLGIKNTTGVATAQDASSASYSKILAFPSTAAGFNAIRGNPAFVTNSAGASVLMQKQRFSSTDTPLWEGNLFDGTMAGFRAMSSEQLASGNLIFGSWDEVVIGEWGVLELSMDNGGTRFNTATVGIRAMWMVDVAVRYPQAFVVSVNLGA